MSEGDCGFREFDTETSGKSWEEPEFQTPVDLFLFAFNSFPKAFLLFYKDLLSICNVQVVIIHHHHHHPIY